MCKWTRPDAPIPDPINTQKKKQHQARMSTKQQEDIQIAIQTSLPLSPWLADCGQIQQF